MVGQGHGMTVARQLFEDRRDELVEVIDLLEFAARVLVEPSLAREDVQRLQQFQALARLQFQLRGHILRHGPGGGLLPSPGHHCAAPCPVTGQRGPTSRSSQPSMPIFSSVSMLRS